MTKRKQKIRQQPRTRKLVTGHKVRDSEIRNTPLTITTNCPSKWLFVDLETGHVWHKVSGEDSWRNVGYVDAASPTSLVILPTAAASIPRFKLRLDTHPRTW